MSRRADTPVPVHAKKRAPEPAPARTEAVPASVPGNPARLDLGPIPKGQFFATKEELRVAWEASRKLGKCIVCGDKIRSGFEGHLSKCLRYSKVVPASTTTS
jgi:hypothetical protein